MVGSSPIRLIIFSFLVSWGMYSCKKGSNSGSAIQQDSLLMQYQALSDSVDYSWRVMIEDDDQKHFLMNRLLQEVSYTNNFDKVRFQELTSMLEQLNVLRYDQYTMKQSSLIDEYDSATFEVTDQIFIFVRNNPSFASTPIMAELMEEVSAKNNYILMHRIHYDGWVKELNEFKEKHTEDILNADNQLDVNSMPLFQLPF